MYDWATMEHDLQRALDPMGHLTPAEKLGLKAVSGRDSATAAGSPLRRRLASALMRLALALDGGAQAALARQPVTTTRR